MRADKESWALCSGMLGMQNFQLMGRWGNIAWTVLNTEKGKGVFIRGRRRKTLKFLPEKQFTEGQECQNLRVSLLLWGQRGHLYTEMGILGWEVTQWIGALAPHA